VNSSYDEGQSIVYDEVHIGLAVALEDGLLVPVVHNADRKDLQQLSDELHEVANRARQGQLTADMLSGARLTISNLGMVGVDEFSAIINPPEPAILAVGRIRRQPVLRGETVTSGDLMTLTLSVDHRVIDGALGGRFLNAIAEDLEHPYRLLLPSQTVGTGAA
jgi:pyruvate dehydrogenase E2 component (dihydrolipoamide acetyltransferase)